MANIAQPLTAAERAQRSVFVGNIPYEATEEQLKEIFLQAGPVVSFRLVYDRETGKPKGYGFCEYQDVETAQSAMRNLNNHDFNGRPLRVGVAAGEQNKDEIKSMQQALGGPPVESPYGEPVEPEKAPEAISKAVASLPPEQMFELMKQMKLCIQNNPNEARNMLLQNPQLAYALLQAQIVMKIVDPQVALAMLHRQSEQIPPLLPSNEGQKGPEPMSLGIPPRPQPVGPPSIPGGPPSSMAGGRGPPTSAPSSMASSFPPEGRSMGGPSGGRGPHGPGPGPGGPPMGGPHGGPPMDHRGPGRPGDMGGPHRGGPPSLLDRGPMSGPGGRPPMGGGPPPHDMGSRGPPGPPRGEMRDPRMDRMDPRQGRGPPGPAPSGPRPTPSMGIGSSSSMAGGIPGLGNLSSSASGGGAGQDQEKAALIMQVLQLTDQQIAMLPPDQRQSILILKEQIQRSGGVP